MSKASQLLTKLLHKRGIKGADELTTEERVQWDQWQGVLSKEELTIVDLKEFCKTQIEIIKGKWKDFNSEEKRKAELIPYFTVYDTILAAIDSPKVAREALERQLMQLTK